MRKVATQPPVVIETTTTSGDEDDDYYDVFDDFYEYEEETEPVESEPKTAVEAKTEKKKEGGEEKEKGSFLDGLPSDIYCDLVTTLDKRFVIFTFNDVLIQFFNFHSPQHTFYISLVFFTSQVALL